MSEHPMEYNQDKE